MTWTPSVRRFVCLCWSLNWNTVSRQHHAEAALSIPAAASVCQCSVFPHVYTQQYVCFRPARLGSNEECTTRALSSSLASFTWRWRWSSVRVGPPLPANLVDSVCSWFPAASAVDTAWTRMYRGRADRHPHLSARPRALTAQNFRNRVVINLKNFK